jgi:hypothetical protein
MVVVGTDISATRVAATSPTRSRRAEGLGNQSGSDRRLSCHRSLGALDPIWWAVTTMTTAGHGDRYPTTGVGRAHAQSYVCH